MIIFLHATCTMWSLSSDFILTICRKNRNCGLTVGNSEQVYITSSLFHDNNSSSYYTNDSKLDPGVFRFGGGLLLLWNSTERNDNISNKAIVENCKFFKNYAGSDMRNKRDNRPHFYRPRGHGGAIVVAFKNTSKHTLVIRNSQIYENEALFGGGGILLSFFRSSFDNTVLIMNTSFVNNTCKIDGGAINVNAFEMANRNSLTVKNCNFERNVARMGKGGAANINLRVRLNFA